MDELNKYLPLWKKAEEQYPQPRYVRHVKIIDFALFQQKVSGQDDLFVQDLVNSLYGGGGAKEMRTSYEMPFR